MCYKFKLLLLNLLFVEIGFSAPRELRFVNTQIVELESKKILEVKISNSGNKLVAPAVWADLYNERGEYLGRFGYDFLQIYPGTFEKCQIDLTSLAVGKFKALIAAQYVSDAKSIEFRKSTLMIKYLATIQSTNDGDTRFAVEGYDYDSWAEHTMPDLHENNLVEETTTHTVAAAPIKATNASENRITIREFDTGADAPIDVNLSSERLGKHVFRYAVRSGDWLSKIAQHFYGDAKEYYKIHDANREILTNPNHIYPGQTLRIPIEGEIYVVQKGDCLSSIAQKIYGDGNQYLQILSANRDTINDPDLIYPGQQLRILGVLREKTTHAANANVMRHLQNNIPDAPSLDSDFERKLNVFETGHSDFSDKSIK
jgi:LysM repeat protein